MEELEGAMFQQWSLSRSFLFDKFYLCCIFVFFACAQFFSWEKKGGPRAPCAFPRKSAVEGDMIF